MKSFHKRVKGFTLSEMLVVMFITVVVVGLAFSILRLVEGQMMESRKRYVLKTEVNLLRQVITKDLNSISRAYVSPDGQEALLFNEIEEFKYEFNKEYILRNRDTFKINLKKKLFFFGGVQLTNPREFDAFELVLDDKVGTTLFFAKKNAAESYLD